MITGIVGKPNVGKSTFFSAATLMNVGVANYPFTTINANIGTAYIRVKCVHEELHVQDNPVNSVCVEGTRLIPVKLVDIAGLVPDASAGRGLGNKFLDDIRQADALIHVVDASGSTDEEGRVAPAASRDPAKDVEFVTREIVLWIKGLIEKDWSRISRTAESGGENVTSALLGKLSGLSISEGSIENALQRSSLKADKPTLWSSEDLYSFCEQLLSISKPMLIAANKCDQAVSKEIITNLKNKLGSLQVVPCAAEAELLLRRAAQAGLIRYIPGDSSFAIIDNSKITGAQRKALDLVEDTVLKVWKGTGVQKAINDAYLSLLKGIVVYPVEDESKLTDKKGNVLPDARIMHDGDTAKDLAFSIHTDIGKSFLYAVDARTGLRLGADYKLKNNDVIKVVAASRKA
ncbi:MAG: redox-regulated ATPase YchF [Nitrososphaerales archaeon]